MSMTTKADYDELVRLRERGFTQIKSILYRLNIAANESTGESTTTLPLCFIDVPNDGKLHSIAAAIAEYEREHKEDA